MAAEIDIYGVVPPSTIIVEILDNDLSPSSSDGTDFGTFIRDERAGRSFYLWNHGTTTLTITDFSLPSGFILIDGVGSSIAPGANDPFTIWLNTTTTGKKTGEIVFVSNDPDEGTFNFAIAGTVIEPLPRSVSIGDVAIFEGNSGSRLVTFSVTRTGGPSPFNVDYATADGTAVVGSDYTAKSGTLGFGYGVDTQTITITVSGDFALEDDETFFVNLSAPTDGATIGDSQATGTIRSDDSDLFTEGPDTVILPKPDTVWYAFAGNDHVTGTSGSDTLDGGFGVDTFEGGAGDDAFYADTYFDVIVETPGGGTDTVISSESYIFHSNVENVTLTGSGNFGVLGNELDNLIDGNSGNNGIASGSGNDTINSGDGRDTIDGGFGSDAMAGGFGIDVYFVDNPGDTISEADQFLFYDTVWTTVSITLADFAEIVILNGGNLAIDATGNDGSYDDTPNTVLGNNAANTLTTFGGCDIVLGLDGDDVISTGAGALGGPSLMGYDLLVGGRGADTLTGGSGHDFFAFTNIDEAGDRITDFLAPEGVEKDILDLRVMWQSEPPRVCRRLVDLSLQAAILAGSSRLA